jgi:hypothetical protein
MQTGSQRVPLRGGMLLAERQQGKSPGGLEQASWWIRALGWQLVWVFLGS